MKHFSNEKLISGLLLGGALIFGGTFAYTPAVAAGIDLSIEVKGAISRHKGSDSDITAIGISRPDPRGLALAREAAIMAAQRNLVSIVQGMSINSETTMRDLIIDSDVVNRKLAGTLRGAQIIEEDSTADGDYYVKMRVLLYGVGSIAAVVVPEIAPRVPKPFAKVGDSLSQDEIQDIQNVAYTGIVIDTSALGIEATFSPVIYDTDGRAVYGIENLDDEMVIDNGMVSYSDYTNDEIAVSRAGNNPLIVKAVDIRGGDNSTNKVNAVVSVADADKILSVNKNTHVLENCAVVFVK